MISSGDDYHWVYTVSTPLSLVTTLEKIALRSPSVLIFHDKIMFSVLVVPLQ